jgi:hypothetical protein
MVRIVLEQMGIWEPNPPHWNAIGHPRLIPFNSPLSFLLTSADGTPYTDGGAIATPGHPLARRPDSTTD